MQNVHGHFYEIVHGHFFEVHGKKKTLLATYFFAHLGINAHIGINAYIVIYAVFFFFPREPRKSAREQFRKSVREHFASAREHFQKKVSVNV